MAPRSANTSVFSGFLQPFSAFNIDDPCALSFERALLRRLEEDRGCNVKRESANSSPWSCSRSFLAFSHRCQSPVHKQRRTSSFQRHPEALRLANSTPRFEENKSPYKLVPTVVTSGGASVANLPKAAYFFGEVSRPPAQHQRPPSNSSQPSRCV
jgi:hypothetical protein